MWNKEKHTQKKNTIIVSSYTKRTVAVSSFPSVPSQSWQTKSVSGWSKLYSSSDDQYRTDPSASFDKRTGRRVYVLYAVAFYN